MSGAPEAAAVAKIAKPPMRNLLRNSIKINLVIVAVVSTAWAIGHRIIVGDGRRKRYAEFHRTYDPEAAFHRMRNKGVFQSCSPD